MGRERGRGEWMERGRVGRGRGGMGRRGGKDYVHLLFLYHVATPISGGPVIIFPSDISTFIRYEDIPVGANFAIPCVASDLSLPSETIFGSFISSEVTIGGLNVAFLGLSSVILLNVGTDRLVVTLISTTSKSWCVW